jgi:DNA adenine methylase
MHGDHGYAHEMSNDEHRALAEQLRGVGGMVVLSGYHGELCDELYEDWGRVERGALADGASPRIEVLWLNELAWKAMEASNSQRTLFDNAEAP